MYVAKRKETENLTVSIAIFESLSYAKYSEQSRCLVSTGKTHLNKNRINKLYLDHHKEE